ncbi:RNA polymerase sigma factor [Jiangella gansuensis]|uniref:RNA polymerase sigma factor n=1 Tax=Jiangella gansuensis TaxID=281473 RepID=UPI00047A53CE|nr:sigma-70 family RNA polymerase sigma factor [Jiangella gansuensis]
MHSYATTTDLVTACLNDDDEAWRALVVRYAPLVWSIARAHRLSAADSEDVAQATWVRLWRNLSDLRDPGRLTEWLSMIARRESLRHLQAAKRRAQSWSPDDLTRLPDDTAESVEDRVVSHERAGQLARAMLALPPRSQHMLALLAQNRSYEEIATALGVSAGSVGPIRNRCIAQLRSLLAEAG